MESHGIRPVKTTNAAIARYYDELATQRKLGERSEGSTRIAFENLLRDVCAPIDRVVTAEKRLKVGSRQISLDGVVRDQYGFRFGYWEAKDEDDDLDREIRKKFAKGYPTSNIIFEDTSNAVLIQNGQEVMRIALSDPVQLAGMLTAFLRHTEPDIVEFETAIGEFKEVIPEIGRNLIDIIRKEFNESGRFREAFEAFSDLCRSSINPNLAADAVQEMIAQHLLTERLIRKVFENPDFTRRNAIAAEIEKVIDALTGRSFSRDTFMRRLDRFYVAIERSAEGLEFHEKQTLLNNVYERFFQGFAVKVADTHGIVYTPQEIVRFMIGSVAEVLRTEFGTHLGAEDVVLLDPCTGTGNFIVNILQHIADHHPASFRDAYRKRLFANEVMLMPYYIASLNIENLHFEQERKYLPFEGICFVDTLDLAEARQASFSFMSQENTERVRRQKSSKINVIIGNPPYNVGQVNENDNNKNRSYEVVDKRVRATYAKDSKATLKKSLYDPYVKFFRWATDRIRKEDKAIVCYVSNNSFLDQLSFDGMRKHLAVDFDTIYHIDCRGNVRQNPELSGTAYNVFGIQVGVGITIAVKQNKSRKKKVFLYQLELNLRRQLKLDWLANKCDRASGSILKAIDWVEVKVDKNYNWILDPQAEILDTYIQVGNKEAKTNGETESRVIFIMYTSGVKTNRDDIAFGWSNFEVCRNVTKLIRSYNLAVSDFDVSSSCNDEFFERHDSVDWSAKLKQLLQSRRRLALAPERIRNSMFRPFVRKSLYFSNDVVERTSRYESILSSAETESENRVICCAINSQIPFSATIVNKIPCIDFGGRPGQTIPLYTYTKSGKRLENVTDWALQKFREAYAKTPKVKGKPFPEITKRDIFHYVYAVLHHPVYRERFAEALKKELPRIPLLLDFHGMADAGKELAEIHLNYENASPCSLTETRTGSRPPSQYYVVDDRMRLSKDKTALKVNDGLTLEGIAPEVFRYRLGNRSALDWIIDQYQVERDKVTGEITSDPNREDDPEYIVRLVKQIITISLETNRIVDNLPKYEVIEGK